MPERRSLLLPRKYRQLDSFNSLSSAVIKRRHPSSRDTRVDRSEMPGHDVPCKRRA